jgi:hypothetical protein
MCSTNRWGLPTDISHYRLFFGFFLYGVPFELVTAQPSYMKQKLRQMWTNSISKFGRHNINGGAVDNT